VFVLLFFFLVFILFDLDMCWLDSIYILHIMVPFSNQKKIFPSFLLFPILSFKSSFYLDKRKKPSLPSFPFFKNIK